LKINKINILKYTLLILINITLLNSPIFSQSKNWTDYINLSDDVYFDDNLFINSNSIKNNEYNFYPKRYPVVYTKFNDKQILIWNDTKEKITDLEFDKIEEISYNTFIVKKNELYGIIDSIGNFIIPIKYHMIGCIDPKIIIYDLMYGHKPFRSRVTENNFSNLIDNQLFICLYINKKITNGIYNYTEILNRKGKVLIHENNSSVDVDYFKIKNDLFTIYKINHDQNPNPGYTTPPKFKISKWGDSSFIKFDGEILESYGDNWEDLISIIKKPLYKVYKKNNKLSFFDLESLKEITSIPQFDELGNGSYILKKNEMFTTRNIVKTKYVFNEIYQNIISKDFKVILPFIQGYNFIENDYDSSLIEFSSDRGIGLIKIGKGIVVPPQFLFFNYLDNYNKFDKSKLRIVRNLDRSENIFDLSKLNLVLKRNYDSIIFNGKEFECTFEGKTENIFLEIY